jgi:thioredoxin
VSETATSALGEASDATFDRDVLQAGGPVLVEFFATWCGNCRRVATTLEKLASEFAGRVPFVKVNADDNPQLVRRYRVSSTPTLVMFVAGEPTGTLVGAQPEAAVRDLLAPAMGGGRRAGEGPNAAPVAWVPVEACTLPSAEQPLRVAEFDALFATALHGIDRRGPGWLRLHLAGHPQVEAIARELLGRESECCSFFYFQLTPTGEGLQLDVRVPAARVDVLDGITRRAQAARARPGSAS